MDGLGVVRLILMLFHKMNGTVFVPPQPWSPDPVTPVADSGGVAYLILRDAYRAGDRPFAWIGWMIVLS